MSEIATELVVILLLLVVNGVFAMSEIAVVTSRKIRLEQRADDGDKGAAAALSLARALDGSAMDHAAVRAAARPPLFVPASMPVLHLVETLRASRRDAAVLLDEYGGTTGVVTLHDVLEAIVGDLPRSEEEVEEPAVVRRADGSWLVEGGMPIEDIAAELDLDLRDDDGPADYQTLAGFVLARLGRVPVAGDGFAWHGRRFEVVDMDGRRVDKVLIHPSAGGDDGRAGRG